MIHVKQRCAVTVGLIHVKQRFPKPLTGRL
jgi:hypothetical protein